MQFKWLERGKKQEQDYNSRQAGDSFIVKPSQQVEQIKTKRQNSLNKLLGLCFLLSLSETSESQATVSGE